MADPLTQELFAEWSDRAAKARAGYVAKQDRVFLTRATLVSVNIQRLVEYITSRVDGAFQHPLIAGELELDGLSVENPRFQSKHLAKYRQIAVSIVHGIPVDEIHEYTRHYSSWH